MPLVIYASQNSQAITHAICAARCKLMIPFQIFSNCTITDL